MMKYLVPAALYKDEIESGFKRYYYTDNMMFYTASLYNYFPTIYDEPDDEHYQFAIIDKDKCIGYIGFIVKDNVAKDFSLFSFDNGNAIIGKALFFIMEDLVSKYNLHRISWNMVEGNPVEKHYDKFCEKYNGRKLILKDVFKDRYGNYRNKYIYEIILN